MTRIVFILALSVVVAAFSCQLYGFDLGFSFNSMGDTTAHPELIANGGFDVDANWNKGAGWTITGGQLNGTAVSAFVTCGQVLAKNLTVGAVYQLSYYMPTYTAGTVRAQISGGTVQNLSYQSSTGVHTGTFTALSGNGTVNFQAGGGGFTGAVDSVSLKKKL